LIDGSKGIAFQRLMKKIGIVIMIGALAGAGYYVGMRRGSATQTAANGGGAGQRGGGGGGFQGGGGFPGGFGGGGFGGGGRGGGRQPMVVELGTVVRASINQEITLVGNLIGDATVSVAPRTAGRLQDISVRLGDRVNRGQRLAQIEDFEIKEQVKQAEAAQEVSLATIRQREADLQLAKTNVERSRSLFERQLLPKQTLDDNEARYQSAVAAVDLAKAQTSQSKARLDELRINLANTIITSPVTGFVARRAVDPGAFVGQNAPIVDVVDITSVRLVANVVEKDLKELQRGNATTVEVDAFPGETFTGRIARVSPVLDPATRTAPIEVEIPNGDFRLKPGMYARVGVVTNVKKEALVAPANAVIDLGGRRGVFEPINNAAVFRAVQVGTEQLDRVEILGGVTEGTQVITTGAAALRDGDRILLSGDEGGPVGEGRRGGRRGTGTAPAGGTGLAPAGGTGAAPATGPAQAPPVAGATAAQSPSGTTSPAGGFTRGGSRDGAAQGGEGFRGEGRRGRRGDGIPQQ
jgi:membrane fusion protein (multidrug efflux system)